MMGGRLIGCLEAIKEWMSSNWLCLNEAKTEVMLSGTIVPLAGPTFPWPDSFGGPLHRWTPPRVLESSSIGRGRWLTRSLTW